MHDLDTPTQVKGKNVSSEDGENLTARWNYSKPDFSVYVHTDGTLLENEKLVQRKASKGAGTKNVITTYIEESTREACKCLKQGGLGTSKIYDLKAS